ncbi:hypothetical protein SAZ11_58320 [Streptomyces sp. FXJ1.4098]|nr:hypothetical protein [Streptomyces sp. FXJ1.4098]
MPDEMGHLQQMEAVRMVGDESARRLGELDVLQVFYAGLRDVVIGIDAQYVPIGIRRGLMLAQPVQRTRARKGHQVVGPLHGERAFRRPHHFGCQFPALLVLFIQVVVGADRTPCAAAQVVPGAAEVGCGSVIRRPSAWRCGSSGPQTGSRRIRAG